MTTAQFVKKLQQVKPNLVGQSPVVVLPLGEFERMQEELEMLHSKQLPKDIAESRREIARGKTVAFDAVKRRIRTNVRRRR